MNFDNCYFLIPARRGSKGFPFKNRKLFDQTAITIPKRFRDKVFVSTDDEFLKERAKYYNFNVIDRPDELSQDTSSVKDVMKHFIKTQSLKNDSKIILLFLTYPQRTWPDIKNIFKFFSSKDAKSLICSERVTEHPYLCFYEKEDDRAELIIKHSLYRRQEYPKCIRQSMFLACYEAEIIDNIHDLLFEENTIFYKLDEHKIDVDYKEDYMDKIADERFVPREFNISFDPFLRHFDRYIQCVKLLKKTGQGEKWLDCACGTGYGTNFLTNFADFLVGYDIDKDTVDYANENYKNDNCEFTYDISHYKKTFDVVLSVETIEHMPTEDAKEFLKNLRNALKEDGQMVITTPIVKETNNNPVNKFHFVEYSDKDFRQLLMNEGFSILESNFIETTFTDGETKDQGYYRCGRNK
jgi:CMP-N-acetylneuraminic acid synthetase/protein-L-isoaspartate O-methyltransferase